jgi:hypothetical protein
MKRASPLALPLMRCRGTVAAAAPAASAAPPAAAVPAAAAPAAAAPAAAAAAITGVAYMLLELKVIIPGVTKLAGRLHSTTNEILLLIDGDSKAAIDVVLLHTPERHCLQTSLSRVHDKFSGGDARLTDVIWMPLRNCHAAGTSSGALLSTSLCSGAKPEALMAGISELAKYCRDNSNCQNKLDQAVRVQVKKLLSPNAYQRCSGTNFVSMTQGKFPSSKAKNLLVSNYKSNQELVDAVAASCYIPLWSGNVGKREWTAKFKGESAYDGFFSNSQPCAPGVSYCIKVNSKSPPWTR